MIRDNVLSMLGIAAKAGRVASGEYQTENVVKSGKSHLVIVAEDASDNTKKTFRNKCEFYETPMVIYGNKESLGHAIGREYRASLAVTDEGFAKALLKKLAQKTTE
ncbi:putative ribosomal protein YlxQ [Lachnospiraceae bacterium]|nr:putative ribosomal protein YlxQ [Lachnospiraceae bacterium]